MSLSVNQNQNRENRRFGFTPRVFSDIAQKNPSDAISNNIIVNACDYKDDPKLITAVTIPVWAAISGGMQVFNKHCATTKKNGKDTSILHNVQDFSDKIGKKFDSSKAGKTINKGSSKITSFFKNKIISKNKFLNSVFNTPAEPKLGMAKMVSRGTIAETAQDAIDVVERFCINSDKTIEQLGLAKQIDFDRICKDPYKYLDDLKGILKKIPEQPIEVCRSKNPITKKILSRKVYPSELMNKINTLSGKSLRNEAAKLSKAGKAMPKAFLRTMEGLTNGTAGGKVAIFMQAYSIADAIVRAAQAPKGEKFKTFTEALTYDLSYYLMMPVGMGIMYHAAGAKYTGMNPQQVARYRKGVKLLNEKVASGKCSKAQYDRVKTLLKTQLKGKSNIFDKPVKDAGKILSTGLEQIAPYTNETTNAFVKSLKNIPNKLKGISGGVMRFALYMFVIAPPLAKGVTKISHLIFGKPTYSITDKEKTVGDVAPENVVKTVTVQKPNRQFEKAIYSDKTNYVDMYNEAVRLEAERQEFLKQSEEVKTVKTVVNVVKEEPKYFEETQNGYIPSTKGYVEEQEKDETTYIPSTRPAPAVPEDLTAAKRAIINSYAAENITNKRIKDRFRRKPF